MSPIEIQWLFHKQSSVFLVGHAVFNPCIRRQVWLSTDIVNQHKTIYGAIMGPDNAHQDSKITLRHTSSSDEAHKVIVLMEYIFELYNWEWLLCVHVVPEAFTLCSPTTHGSVQYNQRD